MGKIFWILIALLTASTGYSLKQHFAGPAKITLENPQRIVWEKPTTDAEWAEDVKAENFDIKSTGKLEEMREVHAAKLERIKKGNGKVVECAECVRYDLKQGHPDATPQEIENLYQEQLAQYEWDLEKLTQSVERMDAELRLREEGFVTVEREAEPLFGSINSRYVRTIND